MGAVRVAVAMRFSLGWLLVGFSGCGISGITIARCRVFRLPRAHR